jgi:hypothetical protein
MKTTLSEINGEWEIRLEIEKILEIRIKKIQNLAITEYIVKWRIILVKEGIWEDDLLMHTPLWLLSVENNTCLRVGHVNP